MRQGPIYPMRIHTNEHGELTLPVPLELVMDFEGYDYVNWRDDRKGVFTLILFNEECAKGLK